MKKSTEQYQNAVRALSESIENQIEAFKEGWAEESEILTYYLNLQSNSSSDFDGNVVISTKAEVSNFSLLQMGRAMSVEQAERVLRGAQLEHQGGEDVPEYQEEFFGLLKKIFNKK